MKPTLFIIKTGSTFPDTKKRFGDFDDWTLAALGPLAVETAVVDAEHLQPLPAACTCAGVVITGSHAMVTQELPWSLAIEAWLPSLIEARVPILGICFGHQLLAKAMGGAVHYHPKGREVGTVEIRLTAEAVDDVLFGTLPARFHVHATHAQSVQTLPAGAVRLAENHHETHHAFRLGDCAWGVQFHPEYDSAVMRAYIQAQADELTRTGCDVAQRLGEVKETPQAVEMLRNFARFVESRQTRGG